MYTNQTIIDRRTVLRTAGAAAIGGAFAGCLGRDGRENDDLVLSTPKNHERAKATDVPHPIYGDELPEATVPAPLQDRTVTTTEFVGERHTMLTFVFTSCTTVCPGLTATLRRVQADAIERGYADEFAFQAITFDPEYDTEPVLREYGRQMGVDFDVGNWYFLRPETPADARTVVEDTFGVAFERADDGDSTEMGSDGTNESDGDHDGHGGGHRHFVHTALVLLVNRDGLVERAYTGGAPAPQTVLEDARTIVEEE